MQTQPSAAIVSHSHLKIIMSFSFSLFSPPHCNIFHQCALLRHSHLSFCAVVSPSSFLPVSLCDAKVPDRVSGHVFICIHNGLTGFRGEVLTAAWEMSGNTQGRGRFAGALLGCTICDHLYRNRSRFACECWFPKSTSCQRTLLAQAAVFFSQLHSDRREQSAR